jgi:hypothetical protein
MEGQEWPEQKDFVIGIMHEDRESTPAKVFGSDDRRPAPAWFALI